MCQAAIHINLIDKSGRDNVLVVSADRNGIDCPDMFAAPENSPWLDLMLDIAVVAIEQAVEYERRRKPVNIIRVEIDLRKKGWKSTHMRISFKHIRHCRDDMEREFANMIEKQLMAMVPCIAA